MLKLKIFVVNKKNPVLHYILIPEKPCPTVDFIYISYDSDDDKTFTSLRLQSVIGDDYKQQLSSQQTKCNNFKVLLISRFINLDKNKFKITKKSPFT